MNYKFWKNWKISFNPTYCIIIKFADRQTERIYLTDHDYPEARKEFKHYIRDYCTPKSGICVFTLTAGEIAIPKDYILRITLKKLIKVSFK